MMTAGAVFSGIGGLELGLERAGFVVRWQSEIDPYCCKVLAKHWPTIPNLGDITLIDWSEVEHVDLICGGFPCQPVSQNGHQLVEGDPRWLWPEFLRAVRHLRPRFVLVENVADLVVRGMGTVLGDLAQVGYDAEWESLPAAAFGAPHRRERIFILAHANGERCEAGQGLLPVRAGEHVAHPERWDSVPRRGARGRVRPFPDAAVFRVADGVPTGLDLDRLRAVGNAVVPQIAEYIGRRIMAAAS